MIPRRSAVASSSSPMGSGYADASELEKYQLISNIGQGSFGVISKVRRVDDGREFALKQLDYSKMTDKDRKQILAEVAILESLKHRNIVQLIQKIKDPKNEKIYILMEYCTSGDLGSLIRKAQRTQQPIHEDKIWNVFLQITQALHHCHWPNDRAAPGPKGRPSALVQNTEQQRYQVLHRDLKPENVFLSDEFVKLGDFGLSKDMGTSAFTSTYVGTPLYMPPEILAENKYDTKSDIWSLGCLVFEMCALVSPFSTAQTQAELITMVKSGKLPALPPTISPALRNVVRAMLNLNPQNRPSTRDLLSMDEMKLHRKLFTVQNQASIIMTKKQELQQLEQQLAARLNALDEREKALALREASIAAREAACAAKEDENRETNRRLNFAADQLRSHWEKIRDDRVKEKEELASGLPPLADDRAPRRSSAAPTRPVLEERSTVPLLPSSRFSRPLAYDETPSKPSSSIPLPSPAPLQRLPSAAQATPLRRAATKSLGNLSAAYRTEATPAKQTIPTPGKKRTSIGSPSELHYNFCEDISMASPAPSSIASPGAFIPRPRRSSLAPGIIQATQTFGVRPSSAADSDSLHDQENVAPVVLAPTMIPAPTSYVYREAATPAKWSPDDPDLPSPFIRRASTAPTIVTAPVLAERQERQPLGSITTQATTSAATTISHAGPTTKQKTLIPRSRSGNLSLHQHVLRANAHARTSNEGGSKIRSHTPTMLPGSRVGQ